MQDLVPEMTVSVLERDPSVSQFPDWVEEFFAAVGSDQTLDAWLTKLRDEVLRLSKKFMSHGRLFVAPSIPEDKLVNVRAKCNLSRDEPIWVLLDCTVLGSAKDCVVFTRHGIASHYKGRSILVAYEELPRLAFGTDEWDPYSAAISRPEGDARIPLAGSKISAQDFLKLVDWLQTFMRDHELEAALHGYS
jgi:hypothetical protein